MDKLFISGGARLNGEVIVSGAKNAALPIFCASLLTRDPCILSNVPKLNDISTMLRLLAHIGVKSSFKDNGIFHLQADRVEKYVAPYELVKAMRASILVLGPLLARFGYARISLPGGCAIGRRPIDQHIKGLTALGAEISITQGSIVARAERLRGTSISADAITVTGTENLLMAATLAEGETILENAAREPEVVNLADLLIKMGAHISGHGTSRIVIEGVQSLHGAEHHIIPDRVEAGTFLCAVGAAGGDITLREVNPDSMHATLDKLSKAGLRIEAGENWVRGTMHQRPLAVDFCTHEYPGLATDMQAQLTALNTIARGTSTITENIFENRYMHIQELKRLGADIEVVSGRVAVVRGVPCLTGAPVMATDLRASASLVIAGIAAEGNTQIDCIHHLDRGYESIEKKLQKLGANIERVHVTKS